MKTIELATRSLLHILLALCAAFLCVRLCTGCQYLQTLHEDAKPALAVALKDAYALGGATAVSNKIEQLVVDGKVTPEQAAQLHVLAQRVFDRAVDRLETDALNSSLESPAASAATTIK